jgi:hypothetical protein
MNTLLFLGSLLIFVGCVGSLVNLRRAHAMYFYLAQSIGFILLIFALFAYPIPWVLLIIHLAVLAIVWLPASLSSPDTVVGKNIIGPFFFRMFYALFSLCVAVILYPLVLAWVPSLPPLIIVTFLFVIVLSLLSIGVSEVPSRITIFLMSFVQSFALLYLLREPSLFLVGMFSLLELTIAFVLSQFYGIEPPLQRDTVA